MSSVSVAALAVAGVCGYAAADIVTEDLSKLAEGKSKTLLGADEAEQKQIAEWVASDVNDLAALEKKLANLTFLVGNRLTIADLSVYGRVHAAVSAFKPKDCKATPSVARWFDNVQSTSGVRSLTQDLPQLSLNRSSAIFNLSTDAVAPAAKPSKEQQQQQGKGQGKGNDAKAQAKKEKKEKKKKAKKPVPQGNGAADILRVDFRVGLVLSAELHPVEERLYVEQIDIGEDKPRTVVSGLGGVVPLESMKGRKVVMMANLPAGDLKGVVSNGRVMVATSEDGKTKELVEVPEGAKVGERVAHQGVDMPADHKPDNPVNKKKLHKIFKGLKVGPGGEAQYLGATFLTSAGACSVPTVRDGIVA